MKKEGYSPFRPKVFERVGEENFVLLKVLKNKIVVSLNTRSCEEVLDIPYLDLHYRKLKNEIWTFCFDDFSK